MKRALEPGAKIKIALEGDRPLTVVFHSLSLRDYLAFCEELTSVDNSYSGMCKHFVGIAKKYAKSILEGETEHSVDEIDLLLGPADVRDVVLEFRDAHLLSYEDKKKYESQASSISDSSVPSA